MGCLLFKESKLNFLENLKTEGYINSRRELTFEKDVHKYLNDLVNILNLNYDLNLKALVTIKEIKIKTGKNFSRNSEKFILTPIEESFEQIDNRRKELGIYEDRISIGEYNKTQSEKISNQKEINRLNFFNGDVILYEQELKDFENEANLMRFSDLRQELRVQEGKLNFKNGKISDFEILSENSVIDKEISQKQAQTIFNKKNKTIQDKKDLSIYFANYFLNSVYDKEGLLYLGYTRFLRYGITPPKLLIVKDNGRKNPFFQYNNVVIIGLDQIEDLLSNVKTPSFEKFENLINTVAQEEVIHLYADYILDHQDIDNIYNEMTEKDIEQIKKIYGNSSIQKENIVHEYVRMVVQQRVFGKTTEYETFTLSNAIMSFFENLLERLNDFLSTIIGSTNTQKAIEDIINFTKGNFSEELDKKIINRVFEKGKILESNLEQLNQKKENLITDSNQAVNQVVKPGVSELFESNPELANDVYEAAGIPKLRLYRVYNPSAKGTVIEGQEKYTGQWFTTDLDYALSYVEKNKKVIKGQNVTDNKYDYSDLKVDVVELNPSEAKKYLLSQETILKEKLDVEPDNFIIPSTITRSTTINIGKEIGVSNKVIKSFLPSEKDVFKKNIPLPTTSKFENLLQLEQQAQQQYSQYLEQTRRQDIEGFKEFVQEEKEDLKPFIDESNKVGDESINERLKKYEESIKIPNSVKSKVLEKIEKETKKVKEKLLSLGLKQEGNKFELITNSYATFRMKLKELENVNAIISTNKTSDFYQIIARLKNTDSTMELKKQGELPFTPIEVKQVIQEQQFLNDVADNVFEGLSEEEKQILKKKIENGDYDLNCKI